MSKAVLLSIQPKWCELIANGKKTVEVRKTKPKIKAPFKVYVYCTKGKFEPSEHLRNNLHYDDSTVKICEGQGKVIGEFVCDEIIRINYSCGSYRCEGLNRRENDLVASASRLSLYDMRNYLSCNGGYAWHISNLAIYDDPKELSELCTEGDCDCMNCKICAWFDKGNGYNVEDDCNLAYRGIELHKSFKPITRAPQSWRYVEEDRHDGS